MDSKRTIYVDNFSLDISEQTLAKLFSTFGKIKHIDLPIFPAEHPLNRGQTKNKGYAFIEYNSIADACKADAFFNDLKLLSYLYSAELPDDRTESIGDNDKTLLKRISNDPNHKLIYYCRVMMKKNFTTLTDRFEEERLQSLIKAAKFLVIT